MKRLRGVLGAALAAVLVTVSPAAARADAGDTTAPVVEDAGIAAGVRVNGTVTLWPVVSDDVAVTRVALVVNRTWVTGTETAPWKLTWQSYYVPFLREEGALVEVYAWDAAGNRSAPAQVRVHVDNDGPAVRFPWGFTGSSHGPDSHFTGVVPLDFRARGLPEDTAGIEVTIGSTVLGRVEAEPWTIDWDTSAYDGEVTLVARAWDTSGNVRLSRTKVWADHTGPTVDVMFDMADGYVRAQGTVGVSVDDPAFISRYDLLVDGRLIGSRDGGQTTTWFPWDRTARNGRATMTVRAYDGIGNRSEHTRTVTVDNDAPVVRGVTPANGTRVRGTFSATVTSGWDASGFAQVSTSLADFGNGMVHRAPWTTRVDTFGLRDGVYPLTWEVRDRASNHTRINRWVVVDNSRPGVGYAKAPKDGSRLRGSARITASTWEGWGLNRVEMLVNGKVAATDRTSGYHFTLNPKRYGKKFTVQLRAYDLAGNVGYSKKRTYRR